MARVLVIEDDWKQRVLIAALLNQAGHEAIEAANGREGLALYERHRPDAVICDIVMPEMDGLETIQALGGRAPVIAVSGAGPGYLFDALAFGAAKVLEKPFDQTALLRAVEDVLRPAA